jgi:hypothetical protein
MKSFRDHQAAIIKRFPQALQAVLRWLTRPESLAFRLPIAILLCVGGIFSFLPFLGIWMLPLGILLLADDIPLLQRPLDRLMSWALRRWPQRSR